MDFAYIGNILLLVFGFGFVIFWHELGHFLAAKWAGVKVEQFAVGFGQAMVCFRKGIGLTVGTSAPEVEKRVTAERDRAESGVAKDATGELARPLPETESQILNRLGISETEYRLNWIPLGGYVKMLGQDDMRPAAEQTDPRAYNNRPIGKRMVIVSAGVIMNGILAAIGFCVLFLWGFKAPPAVVGSVMPGSPAQVAGIEVGDRILEIDGKYQHDFTKIRLNIALAAAEASIPVVVEKSDGSKKTLMLTPRKEAGSGFLAIGISPTRELRGIDLEDAAAWEKLMADTEADPQSHLIKPGDTITAIEGHPVTEVPAKDGGRSTVEYHKLHSALQAAGGKPVTISVRDTQGTTTERKVTPRFIARFGETTLQFAGMEPRVNISTVAPTASNEVHDAIQPGDVVLSLKQMATGDTTLHPDSKKLRDLIRSSGLNKQAIQLTVRRDAKVIELPALSPTRRGWWFKPRYEFGIGLDFDEENAVVASVASDSPAAKANIPAGAKLTFVGETPVISWFDVQRALASSASDKPVAIIAEVDGAKATYQLDLPADERAAMASMRYADGLVLREHVETRRTTNPFQALAWGAMETRDLMVQFYITLRRMYDGSVDPSNLTGPIGIVRTGAMFADQGADRLLWFLSMISANLAVVNFLPIPVMDGGLFVFLILEKIKGRPVSLRTQTFAQVVGLAMILGVFLFATYHDIFRSF